MRPSGVAAELADQKEERLGKSSEHVPETASPDSCPATNEAGGQAQVVLTLEAPESCTTGNLGGYRLRRFAAPTGTREWALDHNHMDCWE